MRECLRDLISTEQDTMASIEQTTAQGKTLTSIRSITSIDQTTAFGSSNYKMPTSSTQKKLVIIEESKQNDIEG